MPFFLHKRPNAVQQRQASIDQEAQDLEFELGILKKFLSAAPMMREESRYLIPPPEKIEVHVPEAPHRADIRRMRQQGHYYAVKLVFLLSIFLVASIWFVDRLLAVMR